jgi:hypothetical protein
VVLCFTLDPVRILVVGGGGRHTVLATTAVALHCGTIDGRTATAAAHLGGPGVRCLEICLVLAASRMAVFRVNLTPVRILVAVRFAAKFQGLEGQ